MQSEATSHGKEELLGRLQVADTRIPRHPQLQGQTLPSWDQILELAKALVTGRASVPGGDSSRGSTAGSSPCLSQVVHRQAEPHPL